MIGVLVHSEEQEIAREFFELFKTPWEFYRSGQNYDVLICTHDECRRDMAKLVLLYNTEHLSFDTENNISVSPCRGDAVFSFAGRRLPLYARATTFPANPFSVSREGVDQGSLTFLSKTDGGAVVRIGCDLFKETSLLLTGGQPPANAATPTLELHIALLRELITCSGIPLVEIPPVPEGYEFIVCLTHDLDHPVLRNHWFDHTMFGFLYRATVGSVMDACRGRKPLKCLAQNLCAAGKLPFVYLGMAKDPWREFDRYPELEVGLGSTYFVIPQKGYPGRQVDGPVSSKRAARYAVSDIKPELERVRSHGGEVALHGIDAWLDPSSGAQERETLSRDIDSGQTGVRMHWLFFDKNTHQVLEQAGFSYDSTVGYNETVGYRAGTAQVYKPPGVANLLELPLHVMDTALFYPGYLDLSDADAKTVVWRLIDDVARFGGVLTVNWHDRSIAPERLWEDFYRKLIAEMKSRGAWFPTAAQAVSWFKKRRSAVFSAVTEADGVVTLKISADVGPELPALRVRVHKPKAWGLCEKISGERAATFVDSGFETDIKKSFAISA